MFWVISVQFDLRNTLPKLGPFLLGHPVYGLGSSVGIATDYGLDGPGSNPSGDGIFLPSRPSVKWVPGFPGGKVWPGHVADHSLPSSAAVMEE